MFSPIHEFWMLIDLFTKSIASLQDMSATEISDFVIEAGISANEVAHLAGEGVKYLEEEGTEDPREMFPSLFDYLENNGFVYDRDEKRFRESYSGADSQ